MNEINSNLHNLTPESAVGLAEAIKNDYPGWGEAFLDMQDVRAYDQARGLSGKAALAEAVGGHYVAA